MKRAMLAPMIAIALGAGRVAADEQTAHAAPSRGTEDTTYGRIDGDIGIAVGLGATIAPRGPRALLDVRVRYLEMAGVFFTYEDGPLIGSASDPRRALAGGFELRPLFMGRWLNGLELGRSRLDLLIDSLGLELGASVAEPDTGGFGPRAGLLAGVELEAPFLARASGPWMGLQLGMRWSDGALQGKPVVDASDREVFLSLTIAYHQIFVAHVVDLGDRASP